MAFIYYSLWALNSFLQGLCYLAGFGLLEVKAGEKGSALSWVYCWHDQPRMTPPPSLSLSSFSPSPSLPQGSSFPLSMCPLSNQRAEPVPRGQPGGVQTGWQQREHISPSICCAPWAWAPPPTHCCSAHSGHCKGDVSFFFPPCLIYIHMLALHQRLCGSPQAPLQLPSTVRLPPYCLLFSRWTHLAQTLQNIP